MEFKSLLSINDLATHDDEWESLWQSLPEKNLFSSPLWLRLWLKHFWQNDWRMHSLAGFADEKLVFMLPMFIRPVSEDGLCVAYPLGQGEDEFCEIMSEYQDVQTSIRLTPEDKERIAEWFESLNVDVVRWRALTKNSQLSALLPEKWSQQKRWSRRYLVDTKMWAVEKSGSRSIEGARRAIRKCKHANGQFDWVDRYQIEELWPDLVRLHHGRWVQEGRTGAFSSETFVAFHIELMKTAPLGTVKVSRLVIGSKCVSINYYFEQGDTLHFYQSGWDTNYGKLSPGVALHAWSILNSSVRRYDLMMGGLNGGYKRRLATTTEEMYSIDIEIKPIRANLKKLLNRLRRTITP